MRLYEAGWRGKSWRVLIGWAGEKSIKILCDLIG